MARQIVVEVVGDTSKFGKATRNATKEGGAFGNVMKGVAMGAGIGLFNKALDVASGAIGFFTDSLGKGSDQVEALGKVTVIFGDQAAAIEDWADSAARAMGISKTAALGAAGTFGNLFQAMGIGPDVNEDMSKSLVELAADLASFNNMDPTVVLDKLRAGLTGETEPLKTLGVNLNAAAVQAKALELGLYSGTGAISASAKAQATYALVLEQTSAAQGDFARTSEGAANQGRIQAARMEDLQATIGTKLQPVYTAFLGLLNDGITVLMNVVEAITPVVESIVKDLTPAFSAVSTFLGGTLIPIIARVVSVVMPPLGFIFRTVAGVIGTYVGVMITIFGGLFSAISGVVGGITSVVRRIATVFSGVMSSVRGIVRSVIGFFASLPRSIGYAVRGMWDAIPKAFRIAVNTLIGIWNRLGFQVPSVDLPFVGTIGGFRIGVPQVPYLHAGGFVPGPPGSDVPAVLQAGELVVPRDRAGTSGITINIGSFTGSDRDIEKFADRLAMRLRLAGV